MAEGSAVPRGAAGARVSPARPPLRPVARLKHGEAFPLAWACLNFFCLPCACYIIRPLRDEMGVTGGAGHGIDFGYQ